MQPAADHPHRLEPRLAVVLPQVRLDHRRDEVEALDRAEVEPPDRQRRAALLLVPAPNLYAYIKWRFKGEDAGGMVKDGFCLAQEKIKCVKI